MSSSASRSVALVTLGCARNEVDSEELAGRLAAEGWVLVDDAADADVAVVNTCGFVEQAKKDSIDTLLEAADLKDDGPHPGRRRRRLPGRALRRAARRRAARGRRRARLRLLPATCPATSRAILGGRAARLAHALGPAQAAAALARSQRQSGAGAVAVPGHGDPTSPEQLPMLAPDGRRDHRGPAPASGPRVIRARLDGRPWAPLKLASGCDRRCAFCAIPTFRGSFVSRRPTDVLAEARWLARARRQGAVPRQRELHVLRQGPRRPRACSRSCCPSWPAIDGIERVRVSYLQPAEIRPGLLEAMACTPGRRALLRPLLPARLRAVLRRMRRFGDARGLPRPARRGPRPRRRRPAIRSNVIVGFPGETEDDLDELEAFLVAARLDVVGVFGYSDEDGTEAEGYGEKLPERRRRRAGLARFARAGRGAQRPARRGADRRERRRAGRGDRRTRTAPRSSAGPRTRAPRSTA